jgi:hypothetical protein
MAFLHQHPRRATRSQLSSSPSADLLSQPNRRANASTHLDRDGPDEVQDWSVVFPGRTKVDAITSTPLPPAADSSSPFVLPSDEEVEVSHVELTLPNEQDGTGRFTRPSSPSYAADDEEEEKFSPNQEVKASIAHGTSLLDSNSDDNSDLDELELTSSMFLSGSEIDRRDSNTSHRQRHLSETGSALSGSSWAWMNAGGSHQSLNRERLRANRHQSVLPVVFTSGSEGEEDEEAYRISRQRKIKEDAAFEDALSNTHLAQSAGLAFRAPKRRHRKNGESAKGSKRSNSSAVIASDLQASRRRAGLRSRKSVTSHVSARSNSRLRASEKSFADADGKHDDPRSHGLLSVVLRKLFNVEDDEVLQAFLRDEGPLQVDKTATSLSALVTEASSALRAVSSTDDVWSRNERKQEVRRSQTLQDEDIVGVDDEEEEVTKILLQLPPRGMDSSQLFASPPHRVRLQSHVGEPSLLEALQATVFSSLNNVPSGLSILLAGTRSVRLVNYLAGRLVGQIGPSLTERMRKLIDDAEDDTSAQDELLGRETTTYPIRFRGNSHPAISSHSSTTLASREADNSISSPSL